MSQNQKKSWSERLRRFVSLGRGRNTHTSATTGTSQQSEPEPPQASQSTQTVVRRPKAKAGQLYSVAKVRFNSVYF